MIAEARVTVYSVALLVAQRAVYDVSGFLFPALVLRLIGPAIYGQYTVVIPGGRAPEYIRNGVYACGQSLCTKLLFN